MPESSGKRAAATLGQARAGTMSFEIASTAFSNGGMIPKKFTCDGPDVSPPLRWTGALDGTQSFALIMDDPERQSVSGCIGC